MSGVIRWLGEEGPAASKHAGWAHPVAACLLHYTCIIPSTIFVHDAFVLPDEELITSWSKCSDASPTPSSIAAADFIAFYVACVLLFRLVTMGVKFGPTYRRAVLYEQTWLCNSTLVVASIGLRTCRPLLATAFCIAVSIDQVLWWFDLAGWAFSGFRTFPIGVAKYLTWPETSWATRITASHHLWTIPLVVAVSGGELHWQAYPLSIFVVVSHVLLSRWLTPFVILIKKDDEQEGDRDLVANEKYLNVNLSHELWKDITFEFLQIGHDDPSTAVYLFRLLWRWQLFNLLVFSCLQVMLRTGILPIILSRL